MVFRRPAGLRGKAGGRLIEFAEINCEVQSARRVAAVRIGHRDGEVVGQSGVGHLDRVGPGLGSAETAQVHTSSPGWAA